MTDTEIFVASDHRGFNLKSEVLSWLKDNGYSAHDLGPANESRCDALDFAVKLADRVKNTPNSKGVLICGSGQAMTMTANRFAHLRAALCMNTSAARLCREHNDANVIVFGSDFIGKGLALESLQTFLETQTLGGRYAERAKRLDDLGGI